MYTRFMDVQSPEPAPSRIRWLSNPAVRYPNHYTWFVFMAAMDIMLTWVILRNDGTEVNPIADAVISHWGLNGAIGFKFSLTIFVIIVCEIVGRSRDQLGKRLAVAAVAVSAVPVTWSLSLLTYHRLILGEI